MKTPINMRALPFILIILFTVALSWPLHAQNEKKAVQQVVVDFFEAFSAGSYSQASQLITPDMKLLEQGKVWNKDTLQAILSKPRPSDFKRLNTLEFFQTEIDEKLAFVSYYNFASVHANHSDRVVRWLESAVLIKEENQWKIKMLHSTRIE